MTANAFHAISQVESSLWEAADQLRANSKLTSSEYCMPVLGVIFLRHATNRYQSALKAIEADQLEGKMPKRPLGKADFIKRRALMLPVAARYDTLLKLPSGANLGTALVEAMNAIEADFPPLAGQLPKDYDRFENKLLEDLLRSFDSEALRHATGDVFGRIYEYFLMKFAMQGAQDNGEFFTPPSLVQTLVNVIEPDHGVVADLACGSGGMFVQSSHFIEHEGLDTMKRVTIRSNFFYTRTVPCELWHFDRAKPAERKDQVLMLDARAVYRKVTRKIYDFSPEQQANLAAIVWLYRGQQKRFLNLVQDYVARLAAEAAAIAPALTQFDTTLTACHTPLAAFVDSVRALDALPQDKRQSVADALAEWTSAAKAYVTDRATLVAGLAAFCTPLAKVPPQSNDAQRKARQAFDPLAEAARGLIKQIDLLYKLAVRTAQLAQELATVDAAAEFFDRRAVSKLTKQLDEERKSAVEQLKAVAYLHRQIIWLQDRFPRAEMQDVLGLCKVVSRAQIEAADWSLTPGRFVGVAPAEVDEDFDFEQTLRDIHVELADLNRESVELALKIQTNFVELGA